MSKRDRLHTNHSCHRRKYDLQRTYLNYCMPLSSRHLRRIRHYRPQSPSSSIFFLVWHLWNCSTLVQIISTFKPLTTPHNPSHSPVGSLKAPSWVRSSSFYTLHH